jgi:hypothetical protein
MKLVSTGATFKRSMNSDKFLKLRRNLLKNKKYDQKMSIEPHIVFVINDEHFEASVLGAEKSFYKHDLLLESAILVINLFLITSCIGRSFRKRSTRAARSSRKFRIWRYSPSREGLQILNR